MLSIHQITSVRAEHRFDIAAWIDLHIESIGESTKFTLFLQTPTYAAALAAAINSVPTPTEAEVEAHNEEVRRRCAE